MISLWKGYIPGQNDTRTMKEIARDVAAEHGVTVDQMMAVSRKRPIAQIRQEAMAQIYATGRYSLTQVGRFFNRDHTTVLHACRSVSERQGLIREAQAA